MDVCSKLVMTKINILSEQKRFLIMSPGEPGSLVSPDPVPCEVQGCLFEVSNDQTSCQNKNDFLS